MSTRIIAHACDAGHASRERASRLNRDAHVLDDAYLNLHCPICGCQGMPYVRRGRTQHDRCPECAFIYVHHVPSVDALARLADRREPGADAERRGVARLRTAAGNWWRARGITRCAQGRRRWLVIDDSVRQDGLDRRGHVEIDRGSSTRDAARATQFVRSRELAGRCYRDGAFDLVAGVHILEYVQNLDRFLMEIRRILSSHGRVYFVMPCVTHYAIALKGPDWPHFDAPERLWHFSPAAIRLLMAAHGFRVLSARCLPHRPRLTVVAERID